MYFVSAPKLLRAYYPSLVWQINAQEKELYLTFDDGPHPTVTPFVLDTLKQYDAKATFFCIGNNVDRNKEVFERIIAEGNSVGNHTQSHMNGWKNSDYYYVKNIAVASERIASTLFRPPYGRIKKSQIKSLQMPDSYLKIIMWSVLSGDFDTNITGEKCLRNVLRNSKKGSIIVFHDSEKAFDRLKYALPKTLEHFSKQGYVFKALSMD